MKLVCLCCGDNEGRHVPGQRPRLRERRCTKCRTKGSLKTLRWLTETDATGNPVNVERARAMRQQYSTLQRIFS